MQRSRLERALVTRFNPTSRAWQRLADQVLVGLGVSNSTGWCLVFLDRLGPDLSQVELARAIGITNASLVRTLDQLEAAGLVTRSNDPKDRRANKLRLTATGEVRAQEIEQRLKVMRAQLLDGIDDADIEATVRVCTVLSERIAGWQFGA